MMNVSLSPSKILIIEDDADTNGLISTILSKNGYRVLTAQSGELGISLARQELPDLIICDIMMPEMDGLTVLNSLRSQSDTATVPFIYLTARARAEDVRQGMESGADDYLTKPIQMNVLLNAVATRLQRHQQLQANRQASYTQRLVLSQEHQRQQASSLLDNEVLQSLRSLQLIFNLLSVSGKKDDSLYQGAEELLDNVIDNLEGTIQEMHPTMLQRLGLVPTVRWLAGQYKIGIELETENMDFEFDRQVTISAFRLIQESLNNVEKHAQTNQAKISLRYAQPNLEVRVEDNGVGFDLEQVLQSNQSMGLQQMYTMVVWLGGELHVTSSPNVGTVVHALLPQNQVDPIVRKSISGDFLRRLADRSKTYDDAPTPASQLRILLANEQLLQLQGLRKLLTGNPQFQVVGEVQDFSQIAQAVEKFHPQLLIVNPISEWRSQKEILQSVSERHPDTPILVISPAVHDEYVLDAFNSGAMGYIPNTATITDLHTAIVRVSKKQHYLSPSLVFDLARWRQLKTA